MGEDIQETKQKRSFQVGIFIEINPQRNLGLIISLNMSNAAYSLRASFLAFENLWPSSRPQSFREEFSTIISARCPDFMSLLGRTIALALLTELLVRFADGIPSADPFPFSVQRKFLNLNKSTLRPLVKKYYLSRA